MAGGSHASEERLALESALKERPYAFDFFQLLRRFEMLDEAGPRIGTASRPSEEKLRLGQDAHLFHPAATIASFRSAKGDAEARLGVYFLGMLGPQGPLPLHLSEHAWQRQRNHADPTFGRFLDLFHHRMLSLFYRAWADSEPAVSSDRPQEDDFARFVASTFGMGMGSFLERDLLPDTEKRFFAGHLSRQVKNADGLRSMIASLFGVPTQIQEFVETWADFPEDGRWRLGSPSSWGVLGDSALLGSRCRQLQRKFRIVLGPLDNVQYERMLPGQDGLQLLIAVVRNYCGDELEWDLCLIPRELQVIQLGGTGHLGWTTRLGGRVRKSYSGNIVIDPAWGTERKT